MALPAAHQPSFAGGEVAPNLWARTDLAKYRIAARKMRNAYSIPTGGTSNRQGTAIVGRCKNTNLSTPARLIQFQYNTLQSYTLEFGDLYMRVIMNGGYVLEPSKSIAGVTQANPGSFNVVSHGFSVGEQLFISGAQGMTSINST